MEYFDKKIRAHGIQGNETVKDIFEEDQARKLARFLYISAKELSETGRPPFTEFMRQIFVHFELHNSNDMRHRIPHMSIKDLFLLIETLAKIKQETYDSESFQRFLQDLNNYFLFAKIPYQLVYIKRTNDLYLEKIIDDTHSENIKKTLDDFKKYNKVHEDFKQSILLFSSGDHSKSIEKCCVAIEDYFCIILDKKACQSIESYYKAVRKKLEIPGDIDDRILNLIKFIHSYRSKPLHGSKKEQIIEDPRVVNELIIGFTMSILRYLHNIFEK